MKRYFDTLPNLSPKKTRRHDEDTLQMRVMSFIKVAYPHVLAIHCPNGGKRNAREGARFKKMGVLAGTPDILLWFNGKAAAIELKAGKNNLEQTQIEWRDRFVHAGGLWALCRSVDDVAAKLKEWGC